MLQKVGIVKEKTGAYNVFNKCISDNFLKIEKMKSSEYVRYCCDKYECYKDTQKQSNKLNKMNGDIFELIIASELFRQSISPLFLQAKVAFVPNVIFDILLYSKKGFPVGLSLKTSLRERYKQADLEAYALKIVHRKARNYLLTLNKKEAESKNKMIKKGELLGLNRVIVADSEDFDKLIEKLKNLEFYNPGKIDIIKEGHIIQNIS